MTNQQIQTLLGAARGRVHALRQSTPATRRTFVIEGRTAVVTGAAQGIGLRVARELHRRGATVALLDVDEAAATRAAAELGGDRTIAIGVDVRDRAAMATAIGDVQARTGRIDVVVANAGVAPAAATLASIDPDAFDRVIAINQTGVFNTVRPAIAPVVAQQGHIVVVASVAAFVPGVGGAPYMISKAGVEALGRALRLELGPTGATAGIAYFGLVDTAMTRTTLDDDPTGRAATAMLPAPLRRRITPEVAARVLVDGIARRAPSTIAPAAWRAWALNRGLAQVLVDDAIVRDPASHRLLAAVEAGADRTPA